MKKIGVTLILLLFAFSLLMNIQQVEASISEDHQFPLFGWAWSEKVGWLSFNSEDSGSTIDYSTRIGLDGNIRGHAWSENIEWIKFNNLANIPDEGPDYSARIDIDGTLEGCNQGEICGWARSCAGTIGGDCNSSARDGWDGWIRLDSTHDYQGIEIMDSFLSGYKSELFGWAWGSDILGWFSFNCQNSTNHCSQSSYRALTNYELKQPKATNSNNEEGFDILQGNYCNKEYPQITLDWDFESPYDLEQGGFEIQIIEKGDSFDGDDCGSQCVLPEGSYVYEEDNTPYTGNNHYKFDDVLDFDTEYVVRIRVFNRYGINSTWYKEELKTRIQYPQVTPELDRPDTPTTEEASYFSDQTNYYDWDDNSNRAGEINLKWDFENANPSTHQGPRPSTSEVITEFEKDGTYNVELTVTAEIKDENDQWLEESCSVENPLQVEVNPEIPEWEEVDPF